MAVNTRNVYGKISITDQAISNVAGYTARKCYGIVDMVSRRFTDSIAELFKRQTTSRGVRVTTLNDRIYIDLFVIIKYGVSIDAVAEAIKEAVKYNVETFTGMIVDTVNINVVGIKL